MHDMETKVQHSGTTVKPNKVNSVRLAVDVLKCLSDGSGRLSDISNRLGRSKSTVHRLLKTLEDSDIVSQDPWNKRYNLGNLLVSLAYPLVISHQRLTMCALEEMERLRDFSGETVVIYARVGSKITCLEEIPSRQAIKYTAGRGTALPLYTGSASRVLLSELKDSEIERILKGIDLVPFTANTITDKAVLLESIREARRQEFAMTRSTYSPGTAGVSILIKNYISPIALSVLGPEYRFVPKMMDVLEEMKKSANRISHRLLVEC